MPCFSNFCYPSKENNPTVNSTQTIQRVRPWDYSASLLVLFRLFALLVAFAVSSTVALAEEGHHGQSQVHDLTGAWLLTLGSGTLVVQNFFHDGNLVSSAQGESGPLPALGTAGHGVWEKTGAKTFASTFVGIVYNDDGTLIGTLTLSQTGALNDSGDAFDGMAVGRLFGPNGNLLQTLQATFHAVRIVVEPL
jgi:hypothetical protein